MKHLSKRLFGALLALLMLMSVLPAGVITAASAGTTPTVSTGDIIVFGSYPQTKVTSVSLITALNAQPRGADSTVTYGGSRYKRVYFTKYTSYDGELTTNPAETEQDDNGYLINKVYWFKFEPIRWRVLSNTGGELFVMAEKILASRAYNQVDTDVTWETCTLRSWLNNDFYKTAFNATEQGKIKTSTVVNADNPTYGTDGGNNTSDKLFLLSFNEVMNPAYGFSSNASTIDVARRAQGTDFAKSNGLWVSSEGYYLGNSHWWLRSPGYIQNYAGIVNIYGYVNIFDPYSTVHGTTIGARPALKLNLTSDIFSSLTINNITATSSSYNSIKIRWSAVSGATGYALYRYNTTSRKYERIQTTTATSFTNTSLTTGKTYYYKVYAYKTVNGTNIYSAASAAVSTKPVPATPTNFKAVRNSSTSIKLTWSPVAGASGYVVYKYNASTKTYARLKVLTATSYINTGLTKGVTYYYKVRAYRMVNSSPVYGNPTAAVSANMY